MAALPLLVLSSCLKFEDDVFGKSPAERVQEIIDDAYKTLTSSEGGWFFEYYPGWTAGGQIGGYWYWCNFNEDYTVDAAMELPVVYMNDDELYREEEKVVEDYPAGTILSAPFEFIRGRGAVLTFNIYHPILDYFARPGGNAGYQGREGDIDFSIVKVTPNQVTVKGIKTNKIMHFYRTDFTREEVEDGTVSEYMRTFAGLPGAQVRFGDAFTTEIANAYIDDQYGYAPTVLRRRRSIILGYDVFLGMGEKPVLDANGSPVYDQQTGKPMTEIGPLTERHDEVILYTPMMDGSGLQLNKPLEVNGQTITNFIYDSDNEMFVSNDRYQSVKLNETRITLGEFFPTTRWSIDTTEGKMGSAFKTEWDEIMDNFEYNHLTFGFALIGELTATLEGARPGIIFVWRDAENQQNWAHLILNFTPNGNNEMSISFQRFGAGEPQIDVLVDHLMQQIYANSPYIMEPDPTGTEWIRLVSKSKPLFSFTTQILP